MPRRIGSSSRFAVSVLAALLLTVTPAPAQAASKLALRWQGHTVAAHRGHSEQCQRGQRARENALPVRTGAWLTVISHGPWRAITVQLGRASVRGYHALGPALPTIRRPHGRWRVTIGSVRHSNALDISAVGNDGAVARFHVCLTR